MAPNEMFSTCTIRRMCSHYQALKEQDKYRRDLGVEPPVGLYKFDMWPGYLGAFIRRHPHADVGDEAVPSREALTGLFGLVPHWSLDTTISFRFVAREGPHRFTTLPG